MLVFPKDFRQSVAGKQYPAICFAYCSKDRVPGEKIFLPMPPGLEISDSMQYSPIELGQIGGIVDEAVKGGTEAGLGKAITAGSAKSLEKIKTMNAAAALSIAAKALPTIDSSSSISGIVDFGAKQLLAPNSNTNFQNSNIRSFSFRFKLVSRSEDESETITSIVEAFRENMYPGGNETIMEYPGTWYISFLDNGGRNIWIPAIYESYLTSFSSTYNSSSNMFHEDGSPVEVDVSMAFQEVKALNRSQIEKLNQGII